MGLKEFEREIRDEPPVDHIAVNRSIEALKSVLVFRGGRRFVYDLIGVCHFGRSPFSGEATNTAMALAGKQLVGEWVMDMLLTAYPEAYALMLKEAKEDEHNDRTRNAANHDDDTRTNRDNAVADHDYTPK